MTSLPPSSSSTTTPPRSEPATMPPPTPHSLTLILAATPKLGIGHLGQLPWPALKTEMSYFARVTKRVPATTAATASTTRINAVIMGRKTWDSIPLKFRPLKGRLNIVITRDVGAERWKDVVAKDRDGQDAEEGPILASSLESALSQISQISTSAPHNREISRVFVIGGATLYSAALALPQTNRILLTKIENEYDCDTHFELDIEGEEGRKKGWKRATKEELEGFVGESVPEAVEEKGVRFKFCLFERDE